MMSGIGISGSTHDFFARDSAGRIWDTTANAGAGGFVAWVDASFASYRIAATEQGTSGFFTGTEPAGTVTYSLRLRAGTLAGSVEVWTDALAIPSAPVPTVEQIRAEMDAGSTKLAAMKAVTDAVNGMLELTSGSYRFTAPALVKAPGSVVGPGSDQVTVTWTSSTTHLPIADGQVWVSTDAAGLSVVAGTLRTSDAGKATFLLTSGQVYYLWCRKAGVASISGKRFTAVRD